jgi:hypothetical protein
MVGAEMVKFFTDDLLRDFGFIAVATEMRQKQVAQPVANDFGGDIRRGFVIKVPVPAHDALFRGPRPNRVLLEHLDVMVGFKDEQIHLPDAFKNKFRRVPKICDDADRK